MKELNEHDGQVNSNPKEATIPQLSGKGGNQGKCDNTLIKTINTNTPQMKNI